ncbi:MAG TPA: hypothetical protein VJT84_05320 [Gaiellaceae bacterium]|nr:hypothetical protein [Gaiellaceae bacterium]
MRAVVERAAYRVEVSGTLARLSAPDGRPWLALRLLSAFDTTGAPDETLAAETRVDGETIVVTRRSTVWDEAAVRLVCGETGLELASSVTGRGTLADVHLLAGRSAMPGAPTGVLPSGTSFDRLFSPNPGQTPAVRSAGEQAVLGVAGDGEPGRGHWIFTPAPLFLAFRRDDEETWLGLGLTAPLDELSFVQAAYRAADRGFSLVLDYDGHTAVDGAFSAPTLVLTPGLADPYEGIRREAPSREQPAWWREPVFCGWGAQCHLAATHGGRAADFATQERYDAFLQRLEQEGLVPGTVVIDDKWQAEYGPCEPDPKKWTDLKAWIADRHTRGQRVLLWWKAWDAEGLPPEHCVRNADGAPVAFDPSNPEACEALSRIVARMLAGDGLDADGLKVDFTARTPSGRTLTHHGPEWGMALLHRLLEVVYGAAKEAKPDALVMTHTPHAAFADVSDMIRLNDVISNGEGVVAQMRHRAAVARAACPELLVDTDDWPMPSRAEWRDYVAAKVDLGVPSLYHVDHVDGSGEPLEADDYDALKRTWEQWRSRR